MNPLYSQAPQQAQPQMAQLLQFMKTTTPQQAKAQVEQMLQNGSLSKQDFEQVKIQASQIAQMFGIKQAFINRDDKKYFL